MRWFLPLLVIRHVQTALSCSGCNDPVEALSVWTDNSSIWRCEKMQRYFVDTCRDVAEISCRRTEDLGGSLYIMTFPQSPDIEGIKPDHVRKTNGSSTLISLTCKDGGWEIRNRNRTQHFILCDQFITEDKRSASTVKDFPLTSDTLPAGFEEISMTKTISTVEMPTVSSATTDSPVIAGAGYDFIDLAMAMAERHPHRKDKTGAKIRSIRRFKPALKQRKKNLRRRQRIRQKSTNGIHKKKARRVA